MAKAEKIIIQIPVTTYKEEENFVLTLTKQEAIVLMTLISRVGGNPIGPRGILSCRNNSIGSQLELSGIKEDRRLLVYTQPHMGDIYLVNNFPETEK